MLFTGVEIKRLLKPDDALQIQRQIVGDLEKSHGAKGGTGCFTAATSHVVPQPTAAWNKGTLQVASTVRAQCTSAAVLVDRVYAPTECPAPSYTCARLRAPIGMVPRAVRREILGYVLVCLGGHVRVDYGLPPGTRLFSQCARRGAAAVPMASAAGAAAAVHVLGPGEAVWAGAGAGLAHMLSRDACAVGLWLCAAGRAVGEYREAFRLGEHPRVRSGQLPPMRRVSRVRGRQAERLEEWARRRFPGGIDAGPARTHGLAKMLAKTINAE